MYLFFLIKVFLVKKSTDLTVSLFKKIYQLTNWPWKFTRFFEINKNLNGKNLFTDNIVDIYDFWLKIPKNYIVKTSRIWIKQWLEKKWRFYITKSWLESQFLSKNFDFIIKYFNG